MIIIDQERELRKARPPTHYLLVCLPIATMRSTRLEACGMEDEDSPAIREKPYCPYLTLS